MVRFNEKILMAKWGNAYDARANKSYKCPVCPECGEPLGLCSDAKYRCLNCGEVVEIDSGMVEWYKARSKTKTEMRDCVFGCHEKGTVETYYRINPATLKWEVAGGKCKNCGLRIVI